MKQGGRQLHLHPLAQRKLADGLLEEARGLEELGQLREGPLELSRLDAIDLLVQAKRLHRRQVPPELVFLPHDEGEAAAIGDLALPGDVAKNVGCAASGIDDAREEFERGGFTSAVG